MNEQTWTQLLQWERLHDTEESARLLKFQGKPDQLRQAAGQLH